MFIALTTRHDSSYTINVLVLLCHLFCLVGIDLSLSLSIYIYIVWYVSCISFPGRDRHGPPKCGLLLFVSYNTINHSRHQSKTVESNRKVPTVHTYMICTCNMCIYIYIHTHKSLSLSLSPYIYIYTYIVYIYTYI